MRVNKLITRALSLSLVVLSGCGEAASSRDSTGGNDGGSSGLTGSGGSAAGIAVMPSGGEAGRGMGCNDLSVVPMPVTPTVLILVDNSSSMFEPPNAPQLPWDLLYDALMNPTTGVVAPLQDEVRFGFSNYRGVTTTTTESDVACAQMSTVPFKLGNYEAIRAVYEPLGAERSPPGMNWQTPTGHAIRRATADLVAYEPDPPGPKYILLVTDGNPDTCQAQDPQCGQDLSVKAIQDAKAQGIGTFVVGIGDIVTNPNNGCNMQQARCGSLHLQDIANAGAGLPVQAPPPEYVYQPCVARYGSMVQATYAPTTSQNAEFFTATTGAELRTAVEGLLNGVISCTFDMNATVTGNPALGTVRVGDQAIPYGDMTSGWTLETNQVQVTLQGAACEAFKRDMEELFISFPCNVAVPR